jgi:GR25 family glycosyltransferase involved in LPS biosynthesis
MYRGYFLNLERNAQRRDALTRHLAERGAAERYERWAAVDGRAEAGEHPTSLDPGNLGLWLSHERLLKSVAADKHIHILEDDAVLGSNPVGILDELLGYMDVSLAGWDLLFTDIFVQPRTDVFVLFLQKMREFAQKRTYGILDLARIPFACTSSVLINKASIQKYLGILSGNWSQGLPIDLFLRSVVQKGQLKAYVTMPFITSISADSNNSDIRGGVDVSRRVCDVLRRGMFQEADMAALLEEMKQLTTGAKVAPLVSLYLNAEMFILSDQFKKF